jgi:nitrogen-specific signal transduction histidine kinase
MPASANTNSGEWRVRTIWRHLECSLRARILLPTAILFAATLGAMVASAVALYGADMERSLQDRAQLFAGMFATGIATTMLANPEHMSQVLALGMAHRPDVRSISVIKPNGEVHSSSQPDMVGSQPWGRDIDRFRSTQVLEAPDGNDAEYAVVYPISNAAGCAACHGSAQGVNGWLDLRFTREAVVAQKADLARTLGISAAIAFLCLMAIAWWLLGREAIAPLRRLVSTMKRTESGELGVRADEGRPDELGVAARGFDATLSALRRSQSELEAFYQERMVRADRFAAVGELATGLAHEIKNPLAGLSGALELLAEDLAASRRHSEVVAEMRHQVSRLAHTMEALLSFARPPRARLRTTDVHGALEKVLFLVTQQRRGATVLSTEFGKDLPPVLADPSQLEQVLLNICLNACQAMSEQAAPPIAGPQRVGPPTPRSIETRRGCPAVNERGACGGAAGEAPTASPAEGGEGPLGIDELAERERGTPMGGQGNLVVRTFEVEGGVTVEIEDDGPGIPVDVRPYVFQPFFTTKREGNGLGLAISARIVADHGGHIGYRCPPGGGTIFAVTLRRAPPETPELAREYAT